MEEINIDHDLTFNGISVLREVFPATVIEAESLYPTFPKDIWRVEDESIYFIGLTWLQFSARLGRGTLDHLERISPECMPIIFPGFLQWLWEPEEADVMVSAIPNLLVRLLRSIPKPFSNVQLRGILSFLSGAEERVRVLFPDEDIECYTMAISEIQVWLNDENKAITIRNQSPLN
ncbi:MAG: hypothetical protein ABJA67_14455 [Chthonomonadales bacterium]